VCCRGGHFFFSTPSTASLSSIQTSNDDAIAFYTRLGFEQGGIVRGYYRRLDPPDAVVLRRRLR
jgi:ribosomal protein S18 acetylase RimI-like enzyme